MRSREGLWLKGPKSMEGRAAWQGQCALCGRLGALQRPGLEQQSTLPARGGTPRPKGCSVGPGLGRHSLRLCHGGREAGKEPPIATAPLVLPLPLPLLVAGATFSCFNWSFMLLVHCSPAGRPARLCVG